MKIKFDRPISFELDLVEVDDRLPSIKMRLKVEYSGFEHDFMHETTLWFDCKDLSNYLENLCASKFNSAILKDISETFFMELNCCESEISLLLKIKKKELINNCSSNIEFTCRIDDVFFEAIKKAFSEFPVWWA